MVSYAADTWLFMGGGGGGGVFIICCYVLLHTVAHAILTFLGEEVGKEVCKIVAHITKILIAIIVKELCNFSVKEISKNGISVFTSLI